MNDLEKREETRVPTIFLDDEGTLSIKEADRATVKRILGTDDKHMLAKRLGKAMICDPIRDAEVTRANMALKQIAAFEPRDEVEHRLVSQMIATDDAHTLAINIAMSRDNDAELRRQWLTTADRLARTYVAQLEALRKYRTGGEQNLKHVHVKEGGQFANIERYQVGGSSEI